MLIESNIPCDLTKEIPKEILDHLVYLKNIGYDGAILNHIIEENELKNFKKIHKLEIDQKIFKNSHNNITGLRLKEEFDISTEFQIYKRLTVKLVKGDTLVKFNFFHTKRQKHLLRLSLIRLIFWQLNQQKLNNFLLLSTN
jgi:hypothetical protein